MDNQENIHYRVGGKLTHAGVEMLKDGKDIPRIVIERIEYKEKEMINGRSEEGVWVAHFAPNPYTSLPLILNATNRKRLIKQFPECDGYPARLKNIAVRLTKEKCRDVQDGGETWGLRISKEPAAPEAAPAKKKVITSDKIPVIVEWAREKHLSIDEIAKQYDFESRDVRDSIVNGIVGYVEQDDLP
jgi:hypothetical protein